MPRIAGVDIPEKKRVDIGLGYIYGVGRLNVKPILEQAKVNPGKRVAELTAEEISRLQKLIDAMKVEGDLRKEVRQNIARLREIGSYRGMRHAKGLPARGQRTRTNARTKRGKRVTIGALKKEAMAKTDTAKKEVKK
ncbi:MAG: small subunit ribosomal protein S13 [Microgenomates group bacterium Gr01-1014_16]|nr:MAG: small subunit ribosomal protein S13 [Microgenomates group bacterium Gr01-1014_16]